LSNRTPASEAPVEATPAPQLDAEQERENQEAIKHFHAGSYEEASKRFTQLSKENPTSSAILSNLALVEKRQGRLMDARNRTLAAIQLNPKNAVAKNNLGTLAAEEKRWDESIQILEESIKLDPQLSEPYLNLGKVYELKEQWADAINAYVKYLGHPAGDPIIKKLLKKRVAKLNSLAHVDKEQSP
jgi:tetratricopeptide (TPR) repeat protein